MLRFFKLLLISSFLIVSINVFAAYDDEWYLIYKKKDGNLMKYKGPYSSRVECQSDRYNLDYDEEYLGCEK